MAFALQQLQNTAHFIVERCLYESGEKLTASNKRWVFDELVVALRPIATSDKTHIVINPENGALKSFFDLLDEHSILFPDATYIIKNGSACYQKRYGVRTDIYDHTHYKKRGYREYKKHVHAIRTDLSDMTSVREVALEDDGMPALAKELADVSLNDKEKDLAGDVAAVALAVPSPTMTYQRQTLDSSSILGPSSDRVAKDSDDRRVAKSSVLL